MLRRLAPAAVALGALLATSSPALADGFSASPGSLDIGQVRLLETGSSTEITATNDTSEPAQVSAAVDQGADEFRLSTPTSVMLPRHTSIRWIVAFAPKQVGKRTGHVTITYPGGTQGIDVTGEGVARPATPATTTTATDTVQAPATDATATTTDPKVVTPPPPPAKSSDIDVDVERDKGRTQTRYAREAVHPNRKFEAQRGESTKLRVRVTNHGPDRQGLTRLHLTVFNAAVLKPPSFSSLPAGCKSDAPDFRRTTRQYIDCDVAPLPSGESTDYVFEFDLQVPAADAERDSIDIKATGLDPAADPVKTNNEVRATFFSAKAKTTASHKKGKHHSRRR